MKKIITAITILTLALALSACGDKPEEGSHIVDNEPNTAATADTSAPTAAPDSTSAANPTFAPAATLAPDSATKADEKIADGGSANATVTENGTTREVDLQFNITNSTGIDFTAMLLEPVTVDLAAAAKNGNNQLPQGFVFKNGTTINVKPQANTDTLETTLFNLAAIDSKGTGYVFQNLDLAACKSMVLEFENGVPKATVK